MTFGKLHRICDQNLSLVLSWMRNFTYQASPLMFVPFIFIFFEQAMNLGVSVQTYNEDVTLFFLLKHNCCSQPMMSSL
jgi:hypothetical protein